MDEYIDIFFSPSSWVDEEVKEKSCWGYREPVQPNVLLPTSFTLRENEGRNSPLSMLSSKLPTRDISSLAPNIDPDVAFENFGEAQLDKQGEVCIGEAPPMVNGSLKVGNMSLQYDTALPAFDPLNLSCPKQIPGLDDLKPPLSFTEAGNVGGFCKQFEYNRSFTDLQNLSSMQQTWPASSYRGVSAVSTPMGQKTAGQFGIPDRNLDDEFNYIMKRNIVMDQIVLEKSSASITTENKGDLGSFPLSSFTVMPNRTTTNGLSFQSQTSSAGETFVCNGNGKTRVRARRGQATDPHSIAERLRREKIAERMKNLQELVPNSTKVDKASMLDDIIEYVKFLQLQVKVLSMSRLGAAEAVIPLITHGQAEACNSLSLSPSAGQENNISTSPDQIAFEQEVLKLMESNMTMAIQHLQSKGLCLMPIALANALSNGKASSSKSVQNKKIVEFTDNDLINTKCNSKQQQQQFSQSPARSHMMEIAAQQLSTNGISINGCNRNIEPEKGKNNFAREMKCKAVI